MNRVSSNGEWYEPLSASTILEKDFENSILRYSVDLFPGYRCVPFNLSVNSEFGVSKSDLALIDKQYREWFVVEVELEHHSFSRHVEPQMRKLSSGTYDSNHARALSNQNEDLDSERVNAMVHNCYPRFLVITTKFDHEWNTELSNMGIDLAVLKIFVSKAGSRVISTEGKWPSPKDSSIASILTFEPLFKGMKVESPGMLPPGPTVDLIYGDYLTTWRVVKTRTTTHIVPNGILELNHDKKYAIYNDESLGMVLKEEQK